jgi:5-formyltetrahydrofolate cyclo-ligase
MMEAKESIRSRIIEQRGLLSVREVYEKSTAITKRLCSLVQYANAGVVMAYMSFRNEVSTDAFIDRCISDGKRVIIPKVRRIPEPALLLYEIKDPKLDVVKGFMGIPEPEASRLERVDPAEIDIAVIPGVAFDENKNRLGYGAGYYDRFLPALRPDCLKVGIAYEMQMTDNVFAEAHDIPMDMVITEERII